MLEIDLLPGHEECFSVVLKIDRKRNTPFLFRHILVETGKISDRIESQNAARGNQRFLIAELEIAVVYSKGNGIIHLRFMNHLHSAVICLICFQRMVIMINIDHAVMDRFDFIIKE